MLLNKSFASSSSILQRDDVGLSLSLSRSSLKDSNGLFSAVRYPQRKAAAMADTGLRRVIVLASKDANNLPVRNAVFDPFEEVKKELLLVPTVPQASLARHKFSAQCEVAINEQINVEYSISYVYHAMYAYFDRDNVALRGFAKFFKDSSAEERQHAETLMEYQNKRGGTVKLQSMLMPLSEFDHVEKGDALYAMELALSLERLNNEKLLNLHKLANEINDAHLADFIESEFLIEQVESIKKLSEYVAQLRRVGRGHGVWHFDQMLTNDLMAAAA